MAWLRPSRELVHEARDSTEEALAAEVDREIRSFLHRASEAAQEQVLSPGLARLVAAATPPEPITLGQFTSWWAASVGELEPTLQEIIRRAMRITSDRAVTVLSYDALQFYMANVTDRLVEGLIPPLPEDAFNKIRSTISTGATEGWTTKQVAGRIAAELSWETDGPYWRGELGRYNSSIDKILDPIGPPGNPMRENARLNDPRVRNLQAQRANAVRHLDAEKSYWRIRAERIARTESTAAYNFGTSVALTQEGVECQEWVATRDARTRPEHARADGQVVRVGSPFTVGGFLMRQPGDFNAPPELTVHCRCTIIGSIDCRSAGR